MMKASDFNNYDKMDWKICHIKLQCSLQYIYFSSSINKRRHCRCDHAFRGYFYQTTLAVTIIAPDMIGCGRVWYKTIYWHDIQYKIPHCHNTKHSHQCNASNSNTHSVVLFMNWWRHHDMETFPSILTLCGEKLPVIGIFPSQIWSLNV